jgi:hypothetical protein
MSLDPSTSTQVKLCKAASSKHPRPPTAQTSPKSTLRVAKGWIFAGLQRNWSDDIPVVSDSDKFTTHLLHASCFINSLLHTASWVTFLQIQCLPVLHTSA